MVRKSGSADLPLHGGHVPKLLAERMTRLGAVMTEAIVHHYGRDEFLRRLAHPFWFQSFGAVMGMDWHSSGITTSVIGALKRGLAPLQNELGIYVCGGRGKHSRQTPNELVSIGDRVGFDGSALANASRLVAKVDSAAVQDGYQLYHHVFFFTAAGDWCVVQQGMSDATRTARRYHWLSDTVKSFVDEPHEAVCCDARAKTLNLVAHENNLVRRASVDLAAQRPSVTLDALATGGPKRRPAALPLLEMPARHTLVPEFDVASPYLEKILLKTYERAPRDFEALLGIEGVGPKTLRALALASELVHGTPATMRDPARFSFAHGGKDGTPFPVDKLTYDRTIEILDKAINRSAIDRSEKVKAFRRLATFATARNYPGAVPPPATTRISPVM